MFYTRDDEETVQAMYNNVWVWVGNTAYMRGDWWSIGIITQNGVSADIRTEKKGGGGGELAMRVDGGRGVYITCSV